MKKQWYWTERILEKMELAEETMPHQSVLELCNDHRVLIENHAGVEEYSLERIRVKVRFGQILIIGSDLRMRKMEGNVLVICGNVKQIDLMRR